MELEKKKYAPKPNLKIDHDAQCASDFSKSDNKTRLSEKPFKCSLCTKAFMIKTNLKRHIFTHSGEMLHKCLQCAKSFHHKASLKKHLLTHISERLLKCSQCTKAFVRKYDLKRHIKRHINRQKKNYLEKRHSNVHIALKGFYMK